MKLIVDYEIREVVRAASYMTDHIRYYMRGGSFDLNDNLFLAKLFANLLKLYQFNAPLKLIYLGRFDQSFIGVEPTYVRTIEKSVNSTYLLRRQCDYHLDLNRGVDSSTLSLSNMYESNMWSINLKQRPYFKLYTNESSDTRIQWTPLFYNIDNILSIAACLPVYISNTTSALDINYSQMIMTPGPNGYPPIRNPQHLYGVMAVQLDLDKMSIRLNSSTSEAGVSAVTVLNSDGRVAATSNYFGYIPSSENTTLAKQRVLNSIINDAISRGFLDKIVAWKSNERNITNYISIQSYDNFTFVTEFGSYLDVSLFAITDIYGLNWGAIIAIPQKSFVEELFSSGVSSVIIFAVVLVAGVLLLLSIVQCIRFPIKGISRQMIDLVKFQQLNGEEKRTAFSLLNDIRQMQQSMTVMRRGLRVFSKYVPNIILEKVMTKDYMYSEIGMTNQYMTVLFARVDGLDELVESVERVKYFSILTDCFSAISDAVENNKGMIDKFIGVSVLSFWNEASFPVENHELLTCHTAIQAQKSLDLLREKWKNDGFSDIELIMGINSGVMLCGAIGSSNRLTFTVLGENVNLANCLERLNKRFHTKILISEATRIKVKDQFICHFIDTVSMIGSGSPIKVYSLEATMENATTDQIKLKHLFTEVELAFASRNFSHVLELCETIETVSFTPPPYLAHIQQRAILLMNDPNASPFLLVE